ncbi:MAG TPA: PilZ domain-containing protein [Sediminispirochaeta sp.]|nr:PilZ domain-containing protein [Sediminispirochaeta sp.]
MKTVLVIENEEIKNTLESHLIPLGFEFILYRNPVKAIDNIEEISPDLVFFCAEDFPRHWKTFLNLYRMEKSRDQGIFMLLTGDGFPEEEASKASTLEINGFLSVRMDEMDIQTLQDILARYNLLPEGRGDRRYPAAWMADLDFAFTHPYNYKLISGDITDISLGGLSFLPDHPQLTADILEGEEISQASLNIEEELFSVDLRVVRNSKVIAVRFLDLPPQTHQCLKEYLNGRRYPQ